MKTLTPLEAERERSQGHAGVLIDVRTPVEYREVHATGAVNLPLDSLDADQVQELRNGDNSDAPVYLLCRTGNRAKTACEKLSKAGLENAVVIEGGTEEWIEAGLPVERGKKAVSLERQVRITAGSIVVAGSLLAAFVNPWFGVIPIFIGSGLVFSGITDTCGMGMVLARMPWNQA